MVTKNLAMDKVSNVDIAMIALYRLGGVSQKVHLEEISAECFKIARERFGWELPKYKQKGFPDKSAALYSLNTAYKEKVGKLVARTGKRGAGGIKFRITREGVQWIKENESRIVEGLKLKSSTVPAERVRNILNALQDELAIKKFHEGGIESVSIYDLINFLGISLETSPSAIREKFAEMKAKVELVESNEIANFIQACESHFPILQNGK